MVARHRVFIEGGGDTRDQQLRCREAFHSLFSKCGFGGRMPRLVACGGRGAAFDDFKIALRNGDGGFIALLVDSEDPVVDTERPWEHLQVRDKWECPDGATEDHALLMTTCMETWIVADIDAITRALGNSVITGRLPVTDLESRSRQDVLNALQDATKPTRTPYAKGRVSFQFLARVDPDVLRVKLPSFDRAIRILDEQLN